MTLTNHLNLVPKLSMSAATAQHHKCLHGAYRETSDFTFSTSLSFSPPLFFLVLPHCQVVITAFIHGPKNSSLFGLTTNVQCLLENVERRFF